MIRFRTGSPTRAPGADAGPRWEKAGTKKRREAFRQGKRNGADFGPAQCPPMAQEKAIAEAKTLAEKE